MARVDDAVQLARVAAFWAMAGLFTVGASIWSTTLFAPHVITATNIGQFVQHALVFASKSAPYVWLHLSPGQLTIMALLINLSGVLSLLTWPKTSGLLIFGLTFWRQMFMRMHIGDPNFPNSPLCMYKSQTCLAVDLFHMLMVMSAVLIFTSPGPLPETTLAGLKVAGISSPWIDRLMGKLRPQAPRPVPTESPQQTRKRQ
jgi:hypothetical protein